jgi:dUTPase
MKTKQKYTLEQRLKTIAELSNTQRNDKGFGSTGK